MKYTTIEAADDKHMNKLLTSASLITMLLYILMALGAIGCQSCEKHEQGSNWIDEEHQKAYERYLERR